MKLNHQPMIELLNIIHDDRQDERYEPLINELFVQGITYQIWRPVYDSKSVVRSINLSHKAIVKWAKGLGLPYVIIGENDLMFPHKNGWKYFLNNKPKEFDVYAAATYVNDLENHNHLCGFHLYMVGAGFYDKFLSVSDDLHIDSAIDDMGGNFVVCRPFAALQRPFRSANQPHIEVSDYNIDIKAEDIYLG